MLLLIGGYFLKNVTFKVSFMFDTFTVYHVSTCSDVTFNAFGGKLQDQF